jgi:hypothetical protein
MKRKHGADRMATPMHPMKKGPVPECLIDLPTVEQHEAPPNVLVCVLKIVAYIAHSRLFSKKWVWVEILSVIHATEGSEISSG